MASVEYKDVINQKKLGYLLEKLKEKGINIPTKQNVAAIFKESGWDISEPQAWKYKRKAEEEIRKAAHIEAQTKQT